MSSSQTPEFPRRIASTYDALRRGDDSDAFVARLVSAGDLAGRGFDLLTEPEYRAGLGRAERELGDEVRYTLRSLLVVAHAGA
jgi:hypothetical protein